MVSLSCVFHGFSAPHTLISPTPYIICSNFPSISHNTLIINTLPNQPFLSLCFSVSPCVPMS
nr:MAG TPA: hypothetical protein [Caudoviricetes sp.]